MQLHNGPLRSCRKIRGKAAVQQSPNRRTRSRPSPTMHNVALHEKRKIIEEQPKSTAAHHTITTVRRPDNTRSSALVRSQFTRSMAGSGCRPWRRPPETGLRFCHFCAFLSLFLLFAKGLFQIKSKEGTFIEFSDYGLWAYSSLVLIPVVQGLSQKQRQLMQQYFELVDWQGLKLPSAERRQQNS